MQLRSADSTTADPSPSCSTLSIRLRPQSGGERVRDGGWGATALDGGDHKEKKARLAADTCFQCILPTRTRYFITRLFFIDHEPGFL